MTHRSRRLLIVLAFVLAVLVAGYLLRSIINPLLLALLIAYILDPLVTALERRRVPRKATVIGIYVVGILCVLLFGGLIVGQIVGGVVTLHDNMMKDDGYLDRFADLVSEVDWAEFLGLEREEGEKPPGGEAGGEEPRDVPPDDPPENDPPDVPPAPPEGAADVGVEVAPEGDPDAPGQGEAEVDLPGAEGATSPGDPDDEPFDLAGLIERIRKMGQGTGGGVQRVARGVVQKTAAGFQGVFLVLSYVVLVPIYCFFLMLSLDRIRTTVAEHLPGTYRDRILDVLRKIDQSVSAFFRGRLLICLLKGAFIALGLWICGIDFFLPIGFLAGLGGLVPLLGGLIAAVPSIIIAIVGSQDPALGRVIGILAVVFLSEGLEGFVLTPLILSKETGMHPLTLILAIFIAGEIFGFFGVLLAVPIASIVKILFAEFVLPEIRALAKEKPEPTGDTS